MGLREGEGIGSSDHEISKVSPVWKEKAMMSVLVVSSKAQCPMLTVQLSGKEKQNIPGCQGW